MNTSNRQPVGARWAPLCEPEPIELAAARESGLIGVDEAGRGPLAGPVCAAAVILPNEFELPRLTDSKKLTAARREQLAADIRTTARAWALGWASAQEIDVLNILTATHLAMARAVEVLLSADTDSVGLEALRMEALRMEALRTKALGTKALGTEALGTEALGTEALRREAPASESAGSESGRGVNGPLPATQEIRVWVDGNRSPLALGPCQQVASVIKGDARVPEISAASILAKTARDQWMLDLHETHSQYAFAEHKGYPTAQHLAALERFGPCVEHRHSFGPVARIVAAQAAARGSATEQLRGKPDSGREERS